MLKGTNYRMLLEKSIESVKRNYQAIIIIAIYCCYNLLMHINFGDDLYYKQVLDEKSLIAFMHERYMTWSLRIIIDGTLALLTNAVWIWRLGTIAIAVSLYYNLIKICDIERAENKNLVLFLILMYPFHDMVSTGWISATVNYFWVLGAVLFVMAVIMDHVKLRSVSGWRKVCFPLLLIWAVGQEQAAVVMALFVLWIDCVAFLKNHKIDKFMIFVSVCIVLAVLFHLSCPGNSARLSSNIDYFMPAFAKFALKDKLYMGLLVIYERFLFGNNFVSKYFLLLCVVTVVLIVWDKYQNMIVRIISLFPLLSLMPCIFPDLFTENFLLLFADPGQILEIHWNEMATYLPIVIIVGVLGSVFVILILASMRFNDSGNMILPVLWCIGILSNMIIGFSPTVWASDNRTSIFTYFPWMIMIIYAVNYLSDKLKYRLIIYGAFGICFYQVIQTLQMMNVTMN